MKLEDIPKIVQDFSSDLIIGNHNYKEQTRRNYDYLSDEEFNAKSLKYLLCGDIAMEFEKYAKAHGISSKLICLLLPNVKNWSDLIRGSFPGLFGKHYLDELYGSGDDSKYVSDIHKAIVFSEKEVLSHAVNQLTIGGKKYIVDATVGLVFRDDIEVLRKDPTAAYRALHSFGQYKYLLRTPHPHLHKRTYVLFYISSLFWANMIKWNYMDDKG